MVVVVLICVPLMCGRSARLLSCCSRRQPGGRKKAEGSPQSPSTVPTASYVASIKDGAEHPEGAGYASCASSMEYRGVDRMADHVKVLTADVGGLETEGEIGRTKACCKATIERSATSIVGFETMEQRNVDGFTMTLGSSVPAARRHRVPRRAHGGAVEFDGPRREKPTGLPT
ncbi:hypothetical protein B0T11DRAFT_314722 [Plectosphaerella cucumerina]|uniref:Uncharacterized protein n=1 Tax=Plectosphaerella cucumerina TaxID=40658 RepID=A0A8K0X8X6_9PEZI|nr:hypothetical protein B0T11DRAFT_314722 [Plectosphaerella cucumerina]